MSPMQDDAANEGSERQARRWLDFSMREARGKSPLYEEIARRVSEDEGVLAALDMLPEWKRQPNLLLAATKYLFGVFPDYAAFRRQLLASTEAIFDVVRNRSTQTNEPARCAALLPILSRIRKPLGLIEVGASAGLCLIPDRYAYRYGGRKVGPASDLTLTCRTQGPFVVPEALPDVVWRAGLDLDPVDVRDPDALRWLEALVWPGESDRIDRLRRAIGIAARDPPRIVRGDLRTDLARLATEAPPDATLVVFHTAALAYVPPVDRAPFAASARAIADVWIAQEAPRVLSAMGIELPDESPATPGRFVLAVSGKAVAWTDPHGEAIEWIGHADCLI